MNLPRLIEEKASLAAIYAEDGAMHTAAKILREVADVVSQRAKEADYFVDKLIAEGRVRRGEAEG